MEKCREQHKFISGKRVYAITAIAVHYNGKTLARVMCTPNKIAPLPDDIIEQICNEPYTLQCAGFRSTGAIAPYCKTREKHKQNLIGLDVRMLKRMLRKAGVKLYP
jgi:predicted house-cleaning NTP pyrophosphatase (Maf/HAM1 superfamily)